MGGAFSKRARVADASTFTEGLAAVVAKPDVKNASTSTTDLDGGFGTTPLIEEPQGWVQEGHRDGGERSSPAAVEEAVAAASLPSSPSSVEEAVAAASWPSSPSSVEEAVAAASLPSSPSSVSVRLHTASPVKVEETRPQEMGQIESILKRVESLRAVVLTSIKSGYTFSGQFVRGKEAHLEAELFDRKRLRQIGRLIYLSDKNLGKVFSKRNQVQKSKGMGIVPVSFGLHFALPTAALTCNVHLDEMNCILAEIYSSISHLLVKSQSYIDAASPHEDLSGTLKDLKSAIEERRCVGHKIRKILKDLNCPYLIEPVDSWKYSFPDF